MTNMIRCQCGYIAREASRGEVLQAASAHLRDFHPEITQAAEAVCRVVSSECAEC